MSYTPKYFTDAEFKRCTPSCSMADMDEGFLRLLDKVRERSGVPMLLTCAYRTPKWDKDRGRSGNGDHPQRCGVDVRCNSSDTRYKLIKAALEEGVPRIGVAKTYIHLGSGKNGLPQGVIWHYY